MSHFLPSFGFLNDQKIDKYCPYWISGQEGTREMTGFQDYFGLYYWKKPLSSFTPSHDIMMASYPESRMEEKPLTGLRSYLHFPTCAHILDALHVLPFLGRLLSSPFRYTLAEEDFLSCCQTLMHQKKKTTKLTLANPEGLKNTEHIGNMHYLDT